VAAVVAFLVVFGAALYLALRDISGVEAPWTGDRIGVLRVSGVIGSGTEELARLERLVDQASVKGIVVEIHSPGGTVGGSQALYRELRSLREEGKRPVVAWIGEVGASGGYYASLGADSLLALPEAITGSIGVLMQFPDVSGLLEDVGVRVEVVKSGQFKDAGSAVRRLEDQDRRVFQTLVDDVYDQFVTAVAEERGLDEDSVRRLADGRIYSGRRAVDLGLLDRTGTLSEAIDVAGLMAGIGADPDTVHARRSSERSVLDLLGRAEVAVERAVRDLAGLPAATGAIVSPRLMYLWR
jgi:protease-4